MGFLGNYSGGHYGDFERKKYGELRDGINKREAERKAERDKFLKNYEDKNPRARGTR